MKYESIADIYAANAAVNERFRAVLDGVTDTEATALPDGEKWTVEQITEHVAMVNGSMAKICSRLLTRAKEEGLTSDGGVSISDDFMNKSAAIAGIKVEAPEIVTPKGGRSIAESLAAMDEIDDSIVGLGALFEAFDGSTHKFPHPFFGDLSAVEWLVLLGGHQARHTAQIVRILSEMRAT